MTDTGVLTTDDTGFAADEQKGTAITKKKI
jgi:hypothetical protein